MAGGSAIGSRNAECRHIPRLVVIATTDEATHRIRKGNEMARHGKASYAERLSDGTRAIAGNREVPWNRIGVETDGAMTAEEALTMAQLDWRVKVSDEPVGITVGGELIQVENKFMTYREHPKQGTQALGVVGNRYTPIQNIEAFSFLNHLVDEAGAVFQSAVSLGNGEKVAIVMKFPETMMFANGTDGIDKYIIATNSHDGSSSFTVAVTPLRLICTNQIRMAVRNATAKIALKHTSGATSKVQQARETLGLVFKYQEAFEQEVEKLLSIKYTDADYKTFVEKLIPEPKGNGVTERKINAVAQTRADLTNLWKAPTQQIVAGTAWAAYNAVAEYADWFKPVRGNEDKLIIRAEKSLGGDSSLKERAQLLLTA